MISSVESLIGSEIASLDDEISRITGSDHPYLNALNRRVLNNKGKRLRPKLLILCSKMLGYEGPQAVTYGAIFETIHTATLIHDDIIDASKLRRGRLTLNEEIGNTQTVLYGDLLYTKATTAAIAAGDVPILSVIMSVCERMIEGELLQDRYNFDLRIDEAIYFDILRRKTSHLFAGTTQAAAMLSGRSEDDIQAMFEFGFAFGTSFQLVDDYLDYQGTSQKMGKPVLSDLREGKVTLPILRLIANDTHGMYREAIQQFWDSDREEVPQVLLDGLKNTDVLAETQALAEEYAQQAVSYLARFQRNPMAQLLAELTTYSLRRIR